MDNLGLDNLIHVVIIENMKLKEYLKENGIRQKQFAKLAGITELAVHRYIKGDRKPDCESLVKIKEATGGKVDAEDFVNA